MNILIAPDSFKETLNAKEICDAIGSSFEKVFEDVNIIKVPLADGGEGTVKSLIDATNGELIEVEVNDPLQRKIKASYGLLGNGDTAVIEMASSSGLELLKDNEKNPMQTTSYGFGELINHALNNGIKSLILGLGGSATNDCGIGMLQALGVKFYDENENLIPLVGAMYIKDIKSFDARVLEEKFKNIEIKVACDVRNPLCGENGASFIFGPQKGASKEQVELLDKYLLDFAILCETTLEKDVKDTEGCGAAGGLGFALISFLNGKLESGIDIVMKQVNLEEKIKNSNLIITGEGRIDSQTINGKTPIGVAKLAKKYDKKVLAICGCLGKDYELVLEHGIDAVFDITTISSDFDTIKKESKKNLENVSLNIAKILKMSI